MRLLPTLAALAVVLASLPLRAAPAGEPRPRMAVPGLGAGEGFTPKSLSTLEEVLLASLDALGDYRIIGHSDIASLVGFEKQKQMMGCNDDVSCMSEVAGALGADFLTTGSVGRLGELGVVTLKTLEVRSATVVARASRRVAGDGQLPQAIEEAARELHASLRRHRGLAPAAPPALAGPVAAAPGLASSAPPPRRSHTLAWIVAGAGAAALVAGTVAGLAARADREQLLARTHPRERAESLLESANFNATLANVLLVGGAAATAGGLSLRFVF